MKTIRKILIVDDDEITCFIQKECLETVGIAEEVDYVNDGMQAITYIQENCTVKPEHQSDCPDLVFLDINMPGMNGFEFLEEFKNFKGPSLNRIHVVMLTSSVSPKDLKEAGKFADHLSGYITKPLTEESVKNVVSSIQQMK